MNIVLSLLMRFLRPSNLVGAAAIGLIFLALWLGRKMGIPTTYLIITIVVVLALWGIFFLVRRQRDKRAASALEASLDAQAEAQIAQTRPGREKEVEDLNARMGEAIGAIKASRVGKAAGGDAALYVLPWYMIIGPPASGKTTLLTNSGLNYPYMGEGGSASIKGVGGTRNCDWWFADQAVILDTAGRYTLGADQDDSEEWLGFLDVIKRHRKRKPINGLLVGISIHELLAGSVEQVDEQAQKIRSRVDELINRLGITFPVYVTFTKCDLVRGFVEFFSELNKNERAQVWGATLPRDYEGTAAEAFQAQMALLETSLRDMRLPRLAVGAGPEQRPDLLFFPLQFQALRERLGRFVDGLFRENPYQEDPVFRGFYFTSGTQEGRPIDQVIQAMAAGFGLQAQAEASAPPAEKKAYFIEKLFSEIVFPDRNMAGPSEEGERKKRRRRVQVFAAGVIALGLFTAAVFFTHASNSRLVQDAKFQSEQVNARLDKTSAPKLDLAGLTEMDDLRKTLETMEDRGSAARRIFSLGTYQAGDVAEAARRVHIRAVYEQAMRPALQTLKRSLQEMADPSYADSVGVGFFDYYAKYNAWRTLASPAENFNKPGATEDAADELAMVWGGATDTRIETFSTQLLPQLNYMRRHNDVVGELFPPGRDGDDIERMSGRALKRFWSSSGMFPSLAQCAPDVPAITVQTILEDEAAIIRGTASVPGIYTKEAWEGPVQEFLSRLSTMREEDQTLINAFTGKAKETRRPPPLRAALVEKYALEYRRHWEAFLAGISVAPDEKEDAINFLANASGPTSHINSMLQAIDDNVGTFDDDDDDDIQENVQEYFLPIKAFLAQPGLAGAASRFIDKKSSNAKSTDYMVEVATLGTAFQKIIESGESFQGSAEYVLLNAWVKDNIRHTDTDPIAGELTRILDFPKRAAEIAISRERSREIREAWAAIYDEHAATYVGYPLNSRARSDIPLEDFKEFFASGGHLWTFYDAHLSEVCSESGKPKSDSDVALSEEFLDFIAAGYRIRRALFGSGAEPNLDFSVGVKQRPKVQGASGVYVSSATLTVGGESWTYQQGGRGTHPLSWPGPNRESGADLDFSGVTLKTDLKQSGAWGLFRLMDRATVRSRGNNVEATWTLPITDGRNATAVFKIELSGMRARHPFKYKGYLRANFPERAVN